MSSFWTPENDEKLKALYYRGLSASQIARELQAVSRNAVIGRLHRIGLKRGGPSHPGAKARGTPRGAPRKGAGRLAAVRQLTSQPVPEREAKPKAGASSWPIRTEPVVIVEPFAALPGSSPRPWTERTADQCNWPVGDGMSCCEPVHAAGWCEAHHSKGRVPLTPKQRSLARSLRRWVA
jgi:GcrA cell cycle regulator